MEVKFLLEYFINNILCILVRETFEENCKIKNKVKNYEINANFFS